MPLIGAVLHSYAGSARLRVNPAIPAVSEQRVNTPFDTIQVSRDRRGLSPSVKFTNRTFGYLRGEAGLSFFGGLLQSWVLAWDTLGCEQNFSFRFWRSPPGSPPRLC